MGRRGGLGGRASLVAVGAVVAASAAAVRPARAADEVFVLPGGAMSTVTADLDGDGSREIVRLIDTPGSSYSIEAWSASESGWAVAGDAKVIGHAPETPVPTSRPDAGMLRWSLDGEDRVLVVSARADPTGSGFQCCVGLHLLELSRGELVAHEVGHELEAVGNTVVALDMDGDGTDELLTYGYSFESVSGDPELFYVVLRWRDNRFETIRTEFGIEAIGGLTTGDSDGDGGRDILIGPDNEGRIGRVSLIDDKVVKDEGRIPSAVGFPPFLAAVASGRLFVVGPEQLRVLHWPRDEDPELVNAVAFPNYPQLYVVDDGNQGIVVASDADFLSGAGARTQVYDLDLRGLGEVEPTPGSAAVMTASSRLQTDRSGLPLTPYVGLLPAGVGQRPAVAIAGQAISPGGPRGFTSVPISPFIGVQPIGAAGRVDIVLAGNPFFPPTDGSVTFLYPGFDPSELPATVVAPASDLVGFASDAADTAIELTTVIEEPMADGRRIRAGAEGFVASITAPAGSAILIGNGPVIERQVSDGTPIAITIAPRRTGANAADVAFDRWLLIVLPDGRARAEHWSGEFVRTPLELEATARTVLFEPVTQLSGKTEPGTILTIGDHSVTADAEGRFAFETDAPPWPTDVLVSATDALGRTATTRLEVIGFLDYRGLPWVPLLGLLTLAAGVLLFVRTPRHRVEAAPLVGDATLEEIDGD